MPTKSVTSAANAAALTSFAPGSVRPGVVLVIHEPAVPCDHLQIAFMKYGRLGYSKLGVSFPKHDSLSLLTGSRRGVEQAEAIETAHVFPAAAAKHSTLVADRRDGFDWCRPEAHPLVEQYLAKHQDHWISLRQSHLVEPVAGTREGLHRLNELAKKYKCRLVIFAASKSPRQLLDQFCDVVEERVEAVQCKPDAGFSDAFAVRWRGLQSMEVFGFGHAFVQIKVTSGGKFKLESNPFCGAEVDDRVAFALRRAGKSLSAIGKFLDMDKATVKRRLDKLAIGPTVEVKVDYFKRNHPEVKQG